MNLHATRRAIAAAGTVVACAAGIALPHAAQADSANQPLLASAVQTLTDDTGRVTVGVPAAWTAVDTAPTRGDDGSDRATISAAATSLAMFSGGWTEPGAYVVAVASTIDPATMLEQANWDESCAGGSSTSPFASASITGELRTWTDCGGLTTALSVLAGRSADGSYTIYAQVQTLTPDDPAIQAILGSIANVPGTSPTVASTFEAPEMSPAPASLTSGVVDPALHTTLTDDSGRLTIAVPMSFVDTDLTNAANNDMSARPQITAAPSVQMYYTDWTVQGLRANVFPFNADQYSLLQNMGWADSCEDGGAQTLTVGDYTGILQTWSNCGSTSTRIVQAALSPSDQSATLFLDVQLPTADDTDLTTALASIKLNG